jgi:plasminogen activator inhibitor 1 RNA-binding protein
MASTNIFDLLNDDAQDQEIQIPVVKKDVKPAAAKPAAAATKTAEKAPRKDGARGGKPRDGDDRAPRGPRFDRTPRDGAAPRAPRAPRASRGGRHGGFDRHSGTGIVDSEKKENNRLGEPAASSLEGEKDAQVSAEAPVVAAEPVEPEPVVKTFDDFLAEKAAKALKLALPETRAANAGSDNSQWKNAQVLEVEETGDFIKMKAESVAKARKGKKETKVVIKEIEVRYTEPAREQPAPRGAFRGGRGGAARGARGGNTQAPRAPRAPRGASVNVDDTELFPSLGSK